jgi:hypothetical protein
MKFHATTLFFYVVTAPTHSETRRQRGAIMAPMDFRQVRQKGHTRDSKLAAAEPAQVPIAQQVLGLLDAQALMTHRP